MDSSEQLTFYDDESHDGTDKTWTDLKAEFGSAKDQLTNAVLTGEDIIGENPDAINGIVNTMLRAADDIFSYARGERPLG